MGLAMSQTLARAFALHDVHGTSYKSDLGQSLALHNVHGTSYESDLGQSLALHDVHGTSYKLDLDMVSGGGHACMTSLVSQAEDLSPQFNSHSEYVT